jgi:Fe-S cluster biogenesis protein NfuA
MEPTNREVITNVYAEATPNPETMKFVSNKMILPNDSMDFPDREQASGSPLAQKLFEFPYVEGVFIMNNFVTVTKNPGLEWMDIIPELKKFILSYLESGQTVVNKAQPAELSDREETEIEKKIKELLDNHVKPAVEMDGGAISFKSFENGVVTVILKGSCSGCPSSTLTLKAGIEGLLKRMVPEVTEVISEAM